MTPTQRERFHAALDGAAAAGSAALRRFGPKAQGIIALEEAGELVAALARHARGRGTPEAVVEEVADVLIVALQLVETYGLDACTEALEAKTARLNARLVAARAAERAS